MTDELERLLEEEDEEMEVPQVLSAGVAALRRTREALPEEETAVSALEETQSDGDWLPVAEAEAAFDVETEAAPLASPTAERAGAVYAALARTRQAVEYRPARQRETVRLVKEPGPQAGSLDAAGLDRLFQRDARRYDGGFTWQ